MMLSALLGSAAVFEAGETVLILDEIQDCPEARTALKFFRIDGRYDVIGTGSLLGVKGYGREPKSIPVGFETVIDMYPLDFEEFLWANGVGAPVIEMLKKSLEAETPCGRAAQPHEAAAFAVCDGRRNAGRRTDLCGYQADGRGAAHPAGYCSVL